MLFFHYQVSQPTMATYEYYFYHNLALMFEKQRNIFEKYKYIPKFQIAKLIDISCRSFSYQSY